MRVKVRLSVVFNANDLQTGYKAFKRLLNSNGIAVKGNVEIREIKESNKIKEKQ